MVLSIKRNISARHETVLLIGPLPPPIGGISMHLKRLSAILAARKISHAVLNDSHTPAGDTVGLWRISPFRYFRMLRQAELVHIHTSNRYVRLAHTLAARLMGARTLHTVHGHDPKPLARACLHLACRLGHGQIAVSSAVQRETGLPAEVIPAFIPPSPADEAIPDDLDLWLKAQREKGRKIIAMNAAAVIMINDLDLYGLDMIVEFMSKYGIKGNYSTIICVGSSLEKYPYIENIKKKIYDEGISYIIHIRDDGVNFPGVLKRCDFLVRPTITDGDAVSIREAQWYGLPVIASDATVRPAGTILFRKRDQDDFNNAILTLGSDAGAVAGSNDFSRDIIRVYERVLRRRM